MGVFNKWNGKCILCGLKEGKREYISDFGIYGECAGNWFHRECLRDICCNPEKYDYRKVDMAIDIIDRLKRVDYAKKEKENYLKIQYEELKKYCIK